MTTPTAHDTTMTTADAPTRSRTVHRVVSRPDHHWVGDGFRVKGLLSYDDADLAALTSPFLLIDYNTPYEFPPTTRPRGVGAHPHRGFETVTLAFDGAVAHHDSTGAGGVIEAGDVQWMTAARGILHKEYHEAAWAARGGTFHMAQLWVNLPASAKVGAPGYQGLTAEQIGSVDLPEGAGSVRVVAGTFAGHHGPAHTHTPIDLWDVQLHAGAALSPSFSPTASVAVLVIGGTATVGGHEVRDGELVVFERDGDGIAIATGPGARLLLLAGEPIEEPVVGYGPFVMNTAAEIQQAFVDFQRGEFGHLD